jgi:hypothetical protein
VSLINTYGHWSVASLARLGYLAKGLVFFVVGLLAILALLGLGEGRVTGSGGAIHVIGRGMPGRLGFGLLALGLGAHVFWRLYQAFVDPDERGHGWMGLVQRAGFLCSAGLYSSLLLVTLGAVIDLDFADRAGSAAATVISWPGGRLVLGLIGAGVILTGFYQIWRALAQPFCDKWFDQAGLGRLHLPMGLISSYGIVVRAVFFFIIGWSLVRAGWLASSDEVMDVASALWRISTEEYGDALLGILASGFISYGLYCGFNAIFRKIHALPRTLQQQEAT